MQHRIWSNILLSFLEIPINLKTCKEGVLCTGALVHKRWRWSGSIQDYLEGGSGVEAYRTICSRCGFIPQPGHFYFEETEDEETTCMPPQCTWKKQTRKKTKMKRQMRKKMKLKKQNEDKDEEAYEKED
jgi:hypothetical protein